MSRSIPIRDLAGKIIGLRDENEPDPVQATLDASMKAVGVPSSIEAPPHPATNPKRDFKPPSLLRIVVGAVVVAAWAIALVLLAGRTQPAPKGTPMLAATATQTATPEASVTSTPSPTIEPTATPPATVVPTDVLPLPTPLPPPPPALPPVLTFCAERSSLYGRVYQCASTQAGADALADAAMAEVNTNGQATAQALKATATR